MYNFNEIEKKWQDFWEKNKTFKVQNDFSKPKFYTLDMFPYPSGAWLHVWHPEWMTANDILSRYKNANWFNVLHPMWWDAFWLPAENYAIKTWTHPKITTQKNIETFKKQIKALWFSYDWDREIDTTDPKYYAWTQWIFLKMFEHGLAYEQDLPINYCPSCKTWLANEEVLNDFTCERCGTKVEKKKLRQWVLAITKYADRLASDVEKLDWPEGIKDMQRNWIWRSEGCEFEMKKVWDNTKSIRVYTTRIDTVFGMTYAVLAPDHKDVLDFITDSQKSACLNYIDEANKKSDLDRTESKEKTWVFTGSYVINPYNNKEIPLYIWDYVLGNYWTWAVMAVPAHDERDFEFAKKMWLEIEEVVSGWTDLPFTNDWILVNSAEFSWLTSKEARTKLIDKAEKEWFWTKKVNYKLRDWLFSRQRYWGEPIPLIHIELEDLKKLQKLNANDYDDEMTIWSWRDLIEKSKLAWVKSWDSIIVSKNWEDFLFIVDEIVEFKNYDEAINSDEISFIHNNHPELETEWCIRNIIINRVKNNPELKQKLENWVLFYSWKIFSKIYDGLYGKIVCDYRLPLELPEVDNFEPAWDGNSPLARVPDFVNVKLADNLVWKRETNTMPQWGWSCWYYLRYMDNLNNDELVAKDVVNYWWEVDSYVGWAEHAVLHLLYARFWHKFLFDIWVVPTDEPFGRLRNQGLILSYAFKRKNGWLVANDLVEEKDEKFYEIATGEEVERIVSKMSKSLKNVVNPDDVVKEYWADALRLYEMYMSDFKDAAPWDTKNIIWVFRFLEKAERLYTFEAKISTETDEKSMKLLHKTIKKVAEDIENYKFNTAIAQLMILVNNWLPNDEANKKIFKEYLAIMLNPFAPHLGEELWERLGNNSSIHFASWPKYDENLVKDDVVVIWIQVLWKLRWELEISITEDKDSILSKARDVESVKKWLEWKEIVKEIYVPGKIVNIVVK